MDTPEKKAFIQNNLDKVEEPFLDELYRKMVSAIDATQIEESEEDIKKGNLINHEKLKQEVHQWRRMK